MKYISNMNKEQKNIFEVEPPITGGNFYASKQNLTAKEQIIKSFRTSETLTDSVKNRLKSSDFTYNLYFLMQQQADYFVSLVPFRFNNVRITELLYKVIRAAVIYGKAAVYNGIDGLQGLYVNRIEYDTLGKIKWAECAPIDYIFAQKTLEPVNIQYSTFEGEILEDLYIINSSSSGYGGLIRWMPFLKQLENLLKMLYTHSYSYLKFILYDVKDTSYISKEMDLFFNVESPFLVNLGDDTLLRNKFKEFNFNNTNKAEFFEYLNQFLNTYYSLIGRRYNVDFKKERNISSEVEASQDNFDILQNELKQYITLLLDWVSLKTGLDYVI